MSDSAGFPDRASLLSHVSSMLQVGRPKVGSGDIARFRAEIIHGTPTGRREPPAASQIRKGRDVYSDADSKED